MPPVTLKRTTSVKGKVLIPGRRFLVGIAEICEDSILNNIAKQKSPDGSRLKKNAPSTRARKRRKGRPQLSLVDAEHRLVKGNFRSWKPLRLTPTEVVVGPATLEVARLTKWTTRMGYDFVGLSKKYVTKMRALFKEEIIRLIKKR